MAKTYEEVVALLSELAESQKETDRQFKETGLRFQETGQQFQEMKRLLREKFDETDRKFQETDRRFKETDQKFRETDLKSQETDRQFQATSREIEKTARQLQETMRVVSNLGGQWGLFVENLVALACERIFSERGIPVRMVSQRVKKRRDGDTLEIDVLVVNDGHVVMVEVKSSLSVADVREFLEDLGQFRTFFPEYVSWKVHGAVAGMRIEEGADRYAYRQGLFVLAQTGDTVKILNDVQFEPRAW